MTEIRLGRRAATLDAPALEAKLERIATLDLGALRALWLAMTGQGAPKALSRDLIARMVAHRVQEQQLGKLGRDLRHRLDALVGKARKPVRYLKAGTVLVREHQGAMHEVLVVLGGFSWRDKTYPSLSAIALAITGTSWNGPRFFGLRGRSAAEPLLDPASAVENTPRPRRRSAIRSNRASARGNAGNNVREGQR